MADNKDLEQEEKKTCEDENLNPEAESAECTCEDAGACKEEKAEESKADKKEAKKKEKADKKADAAKEKIKELEDKVVRQLAEFENFRNRSEKEKQQMFDVGAKSVVEKMLPIVDNFERALQTVDPEDEGDAFVAGMRMIYKQFMDEFDKMGVKAIEAVGKEFDPDLHNAVMQVEGEADQSGLVAAELQKGYMYHDSVIRHSMVSVYQ
ncbi:MAG: nucleotide exchange factor GrpE [Acetatifactor sp.]|nr:nucleotide exchange factor GrpE [Acetatifactor sp.]